MGPNRFAFANLVVMISMLSVSTGAPAHAATWYVTPSGDDGSDCQTTSTPCLTINGAVAKAADGDTLLVSEGTYTATSGDEVVLISKSLTLSGGWDVNFSAQDGMSTIDGGSARRGLYVGDSVLQTATLDRFTIQNGFATWAGGGILNYGCLALVNCVIAYNVVQSDFASGGGIANWGELFIDHTTISGNIVRAWYIPRGEGAGIFSSGPLVMRNSTVSGNISPNGGWGTGIYAETGQGVVLDNCTITGNSGGASIYLNGSAALNNCTIAQNPDSGMACGGDSSNMVLQNTIIAGNGGNRDCNENPFSCTVVSGGYNLLGNGDGCSITTGPGDKIGSSATPIDPLLLPLRSSGGPTQTHALRSGSPALNAGNPAAPGGGDGACLATDQRGRARPQGSVCDIGAFEGFVTSVASITRLDPSPTFAASVDFVVTFSDPVTGVDTAPPFSDFALTTTGVAGSAIDAVSGSGDTYTVSVLTGDRDGTIRLDVVDDDSIFNSDDTPLGGIGAGNGNFTDGEAYTVWGNPHVISIVRASPDPTGAPTVEFVVSFTEPVSGVDLTPPFSDFALTTTGVTTGAVSGVSGSGNTYTVTVSLDAHAGNGTIRLDLVDDDSIVDAAGNPLGGAGVGNGSFTSGEAYTVLTIPLPLSPAGKISTAKPTYKWAKVPGATRYRYQVFKGSTSLSSKVVSAAACGDTVCTDKPAVPLAPGAYRWRTQGMIGGAFRSYSAFKPFVIAPKAGFWSGYGLEFYVTPSLASVDNFAIYIRVTGCGSYKITHLPLVAIRSGRFAFTGRFYASGSFSSPTRVSGQLGLDMFYIHGCGYLRGGPFSWTGGWKSPAQPRHAEAPGSGSVTVTPMLDFLVDSFSVELVDP